MTASKKASDHAKPATRALSPREQRRRAEKLRKAARRRRNARHG
jgi:hypothetical protein